MDSAHICIKLSARSAKHDVGDAAQPQNVSESQHGNVDYESNSTPVLKPIELGDIDNQTTPKAADPSDISFRTGRENILSSSIGYNNQICPFSVYDLGWNAWTGGCTICDIVYLV